MMTLNGNANTYEEARKLRLEENKKRFEDLGIISISKSLTELTHSQKKPQKLNIPRQRGILVSEPRRSSRTRTLIKSYSDEVDSEISFRPKRPRSNLSSWESYLARPVEEVKIASSKERTAAFHAAEELQRSLNTENPCFIKSMLRSHVYSCFWLGLPKYFCDNHLPKSSSPLEIELEDKDGKIHDAVYIGKRTGLSGGWRGFALEHKLDDGDALVFELVEPMRFKVHFVRVSMLDANDEHAVAKKKPKTATKLGFKEKKKINGLVQLKVKEEGIVKDDDGSEVADEENVSAEDGTIRRSNRKLAAK